MCVCVWARVKCSFPLIHSFCFDNGVSAGDGKRKKIIFWYLAQQKPQPGPDGKHASLWKGRSMGRFCSYQCSTVINYDRFHLLTGLLPPLDIRVLLPTPKETKAGSKVISSIWSFCTPIAICLYQVLVPAWFVSIPSVRDGLQDAFFCSRHCKICLSDLEDQFFRILIKINIVGENMSL